MTSPAQLLRRALLVAVLGMIAFSPAARAEEDEDEAAEAPPERVQHDRLAEMAREAGPHAPLPRSSAQQVTSGPVLTWTPLGPSPIAYDYWSTGPASGRTSAVVVDPRDKNVVYIAAAQGGVWKTLDGGANWQVLTDGLSSISSGALALDPVNPDVVYYATGELHDSFDSFYGDGLFKSVNGGGSWSPLAPRSSVGSYLSRVAVNLSNSNILYVASDLGVVRSINGGANWSVTLGTNWCYDLVLDPSNSNVLYAAIYASGVYKSVDGGANWSPLAGGLPAAGTFQRVNLAIAPSNTQVVYASFIAANGALAGMYRTANGGTTWSLLSSTPNYPGTQGWYDNCLIVDPTNAAICYAGGAFPYAAGNYGVIRTANSGTSWTDVTIGIDAVGVHPDQHQFAFGPDTTLWLVNDGGVWKTHDAGQHWQDLNTNLSITQFYSVAVHPTLPSTLIGGTQDNGTVSYSGSSVWPQVVTGDGGDCLYLWNDPSLYFTTYVRLNPIYEWGTGGYLGSITGPWVGAGDRASFLLGPLVQDPNTANTLLAGTYRVWRTNTLGSSWTPLSGDLAGGTDVIYSLAVAPGAPNTIYAGCTNGRVFETTDAVVWNERHVGLPLRPIYDIVISPSSPLNAYLCADTSAGGRVWTTVDGGANWSNVSGDLPTGVRGLSLAVDFTHAPAVMYLGTDYGVFRSADAGVHWIKELNGLPNLTVYALALDPLGGVIAATHGRGMWRGTLPALSVGRPDALAHGIQLAAVNPAGVPAALEYRLSSRATIALEVYALDGRRIRMLERGAREAGTYRLSWDGRDAGGNAVAGGVYFYRLSGLGAARTAKVALLR
jgi:photosystem II stability/assembly factor-like uncharacterized protein